MCTLMLLIVFLLMSQLPPISTLFPYTTSSDLIAAGCDLDAIALGLHVGDAERIAAGPDDEDDLGRRQSDRKSTRLNSSHANTSYAVFCLKTKTTVGALATTPTLLILSAVAPAH